MLERGSVLALPLLLFSPLQAQKPGLQTQPAVVYPSESSRLRISLHLALGTQSSAFDAVWSRAHVDQAVKLADELIAKDKHDFLGHAVKYLAELELRRDRKAALAVAMRATKDLSRNPAALATFLDKALLVDPGVNESQFALMTIVPLVTEAPKVGVVRVVHVRALLGCGKAKEALLTNKSIVEDLTKDRGALLGLAQAIVESKHGKPLAAVARRAVDLIEEDAGTAADERELSQALARVKFRLLHEFEDEKEEAMAIADKILQAGMAGGGMNNKWVWYLASQRSTARRYPRLNHLAAERLLASNPSGNDRDTAALALFQAGDYAAALREQRVAVMDGTPSSAMMRRLKIYEAAVAKAKPVTRPSKKR